MTTTPCHIDRFPVLDAIAGIRAVFLGRCPGVDTDCDRGEALGRLRDPHRALADAHGFAGMPVVSAEQVHGSEVAVVDSVPGAPVAGADGLVTACRGICLAVYVADCAAVFLAGRTGGGIALVHSGKEGTRRGIVPHAIAIMTREIGCRPADLVAVISPCIRPPLYEVDFAATIRRQLSDAGVASIHDTMVCTAFHPERYYSYRREKGRTGRMLALLAMAV
jgi:polyphenol oxidase